VAEPDTTRPHASQVDVVHATGFQCDVFLFPCGLGAVLVIQQYFVDRPAVDDQQTTWHHTLTRHGMPRVFRHAV
jgi:hypothetical protein